MNPSSALLHAHVVLVDDVNPWIDWLGVTREALDAETSGGSSYDWSVAALLDPT